MDAYLKRREELMAKSMVYSEKIFKRYGYYPDTTQMSIPTFPSYQMAANPGKPKAVFDELVGTETVDSAAYRILQAFNSDLKIDSKAIGVFLRLALAEDQVLLEDDWVSFGVNIGRAGEFVSPLSLLNIVELKNEAITSSPNRGTKQNIMLALLYITGAFAESSQRKNQEIDRKIRKYGGTRAAICRFAGKHNLIPLIKLFAAIDMFYNKFPQGKYSEIRVGTQHLRYEGCGALQSLEYIVHLLDVPLDLFGSLINHTGAKRQFELLMHSEREEIKKEDSYMPYSLAFGICAKSIFSADSNNYLFLLIHAIGCVFHQPRSINARAKKIHIVNMVYLDALQALYKIINLQTKRGFPKSAERGADRGAAGNAVIPGQQNLEDMFKQLDLNSAGNMRTFFDKCVQRWHEIPDPRPGTVGAFLKTFKPDY